MWNTFAFCGSGVELRALQVPCKWSASHVLAPECCTVKVNAREPGGILNMIFEQTEMRCEQIAVPYLDKAQKWQCCMLNRDVQVGAL